MNDTTEIKTLAGWRKLQLTTVRALAAKAGVTPRTITKAELGKATPAFRTVKAISDALGVAPSQVAEFRVVLGLEESK